MAKVLYNLARMTTATTGTGTITLGSAATSGGVTFLSFSAAGVQDGDTVTYAIADTNASEIGRGVYTASGTTLTRSVLKSTNANSAINLSGNAQVLITAAAEDLPAIAVGKSLTVSNSLTLAGTDGKTLTVNNSLAFAGTDSTTMTFPGVSSTVLTTGNTATITKGYTLTPNNIGTFTTTQGTTIDPTAGNYQYVSLSGTFTWTVTAPSSDCAVDILVALGASGSGVSVSFSGFKTPGSGAAGTFTAANNTWYVLSIRRINSVSTYSWGGAWT